MKRYALVCFSILLLTVSALAQVRSGHCAPDRCYSVALISGYYNGPGLQLSGSITNPAEGLPITARLALGYSAAEAGKAWEARRIFINNNRNGIPEKSGRMWDFRLDLLFSTKLALGSSYLVLGPRYTAFTGNFKFVGGNEDFDVVSHHWGLGGGLESQFAISRRVALVISGGLDYFFSSTMDGHDTSYSPDDENVNPREDYTYTDADEAISQPKLELRLMAGLSYSF
jgi:hypothetical protein